MQLYKGKVCSQVFSPKSVANKNLKDQAVKIDCFFYDSFREPVSYSKTPHSSYANLFQVTSSYASYLMEIFTSQPDLFVVIDPIYRLVDEDGHWGVQREEQKE